MNIVSTRVPDSGLASVTDTPSPEGDSPRLNAVPPPVDVVAIPVPPQRVKGEALRRSLKYNLIAWLYGACWMGATTGGTLTRLVLYLGASDFWIGVLAAVPFLAVLMQIPGSLWTDYARGRKKIFLWVGTIHRALYILLGLLPWILPARLAATGRSAMIFAAILLLSNMLGNIGGQAWAHWMADLVPPKIRGKYFAQRSRLGVIIMALTGLAVGLILDFSGTDAFAHLMAPLTKLSGLPPLIAIISAIFIIAGVMGMKDILSFRHVDDPPMPPRSTESLLARLAKPAHDPEFIRYCGYYVVFFFSCAFTNTFWWVYTLKFFDHLKESGHKGWWLDHEYLTAFLILQISAQIGQIAGYPVWGRAIDRFGRKPVIFLSSALHTLTWAAWIFLSPGMLIWLVGVQLFGGFTIAGQEIANFTILLGFNKKGGSGYQAFGSVVFNIVGAAAALSAGRLAELLSTFEYPLYLGHHLLHTINGYGVLIAVGVLIKILADFILLPRVRDPEAKPTSHAMRFLLNNMYGSINTLVFTPVRSARGEGIKVWRWISQ